MALPAALPIALMVAGLGSASSLIGRAFVPGRRNVPQVDKGLFSTNQSDSLYRNAMDRFNTQQTILTEAREQMQNFLNEYKADVDMIMAERDSILNSQSVVDAQAKEAFDKMTKAQTSRAGVVGGANAGLQQEQLMNQASDQSQGLAQRLTALKIDEENKKKQLAMAYNQMLLQQRGNIANIGQAQYMNEQGLASQALGQAQQSAQQSATIKANLQTALNQRFGLQQAEDQRITQANMGTAQGVGKSLGLAAQIYGAKKGGG